MADRLYTILGQTQVRDFDERANVVDMYEISYEGPNHIRGYLRIPVRDATPDSVDAAIRRRLANQLAIHELGE